MHAVESRARAGAGAEKERVSWWHAVVIPLILMSAYAFFQEIDFDLSMRVGGLDDPSLAYLAAGCLASLYMNEYICRRSGDVEEIPIRRKK